MKILIIDIDSKMSNLALKKIEKYHRGGGDEIIWNMPLARSIADKVYISCIFERNKKKCYDWEDDPKCLIGGSGYDLAITLPDEIERVKPRINMGFCSRGCIRKCPWCIVPQKEGKIRIVGDLLDLWLTGFNTTLNEDLFRANYLKSRNQNAYVMRYNNSKRKDLIPLSRWVNNRAWFRAITWEEFLERNYASG